VKFALVAHTVPPATGGNATILERLLRSVDSSTYCVLSEQEDDRQIGEHDLSGPLPGRHYALPSEYHRLPAELQSRAVRQSVFFSESWIRVLPRRTQPQAVRVAAFAARRIVRGRAVVTGTWRAAARIEELLRRERCDVVVAVTGDFQNLPASFLAARRLGIPFCAFICDYYSQVWSSQPYYRYVTAVIEPLIIKRAQGLVVLNEFMQRELRDRFGRDSVVVHPPCDLSLHDAQQPRELAPMEDPIEVVFTGAVSPAQSDALRNLLAAVEASSRRIDVHVYTAQSPGIAEMLGVRGRFEHHPHVPQEEVPRIQRAADILFLPMSFDSPYPRVVKTSLPTKVGDYLSSCRPILVHAPPDCFISWYFRTHRCGLVVDEPSPARVAEGIDRLAGDAELQRRLVAAARERAARDFDRSDLTTRFVRYLERVSEAAEVRRNAATLPRRPGRSIPSRAGRSSSS
jgi:glycosyltransferase involved in cell wall biosynthesis